MTQPKRHLPGQVVLLTRRTAHRQFLLRPGKRSRELVGYMFGKAVLDSDMLACVASCLSNHMTSVSRDQKAKRSRFMQQFHSNTTRKRNLQLGRRENMWAACAPGDAVCVDMDAIIDKVLYTCLQPVAAGLVDTCEEWTGFQILPRHWGKPMRFERPPECNPALMPDFIEFTPMPPPGFQDQPLEEVIAFFEDLIRKEEARYRKKRRMDPLGIDYCETVNHFRTPRSTSKMRTLNPRFCGKNKKQILAAIQRERKFHREHRALLNEFRDGRRDVVFPPGTIHMARRAGVNVGPVPADDPHLSRWEWTDRLRDQWATFAKRRGA